MMRYLLLFIFSLIFGWAIAKTKQDSLPYSGLIKSYNKAIKISIDSAEKINNKLESIAISKGDNFFLAIFELNKSIIAYYRSDLKRSKQHAYMALKIGKQHVNNYVLMRSQNILGAIYFIEGDINTSEKWYNEKIETAKRINDTTAEMETYYNLGLIYAQTGKYLESANTTFKAIKYFERKKDTMNLIYQLQSIGVTYYNLDDRPSSLRYLYKAADFCIKAKDNYQLSGIYLDISASYFDTANVKLHDSVLKYINKAMNLSKSEKDDFHYAIGLNSYAEFYSKTHQDRKAIVMATTALRMNTESERMLGLTQNYDVLSRSYLRINILDSALYFARKGYNIAKQQNQKENLLSISLTISQTFEKKKMYDSSLTYHQLYFTHYQGIQKSVQLRGIAKQELMYEKENQDQLRLKEQLISQTKLEKQKQINTIVIVASVLLSVLLVISFVNYRQKQKASAEILKQKKLLEEKQKEIHDSIVYASRIQKSLMPTTLYLKKKLHEND